MVLFDPSWHPNLIGTPRTSQKGAICGIVARQRWRFCLFATVAMWRTSQSVASASIPRTRAAIEPDREPGTLTLEQSRPQRRRRDRQVLPSAIRLVLQSAVWASTRIASVACSRGAAAAGRVEARTKETLLIYIYYPLRPSRRTPTVCSRKKALTHRGSRAPPLGGPACCGVRNGRELRALGGTQQPWQAARLTLATL